MCLSQGRSRGISTKRSSISFGGVGGRPDGGAPDAVYAVWRSFLRTQRCHMALLEALWARIPGRPSTTWRKWSWSRSTTRGTPPRCLCSICIVITSAAVYIHGRLACGAAPHMQIQKIVRGKTSDYWNWQNFLYHLRG